MRKTKISDNEPQRIGVLLFDQFSNHCLANALEPLRAANMLAGRALYEWNILSTGGGPIVSSSGLSIAADAALGDSGRGDVLFVIPSYGHTRHDTPQTARMLRAASGRYPVMVGMDMGSWLLAAADLLNGRSATIHWDETERFEERFPDVQVSRDRVVFDGTRWSCAGAMTAFELVLQMIGQTHGESLRLEVAALFMHPAGNSGTARPTARTAQVSAAIDLMRRNLEEPVTIPQLAKALNLSQRKLDAIFRADVGTSPQTIYKQMRLQAAKRYVEQTSLPIAEIAVRCGYADPSAMTRAFREEYGSAPTALRG
jgi:AraC family carnitine catabolism transcriptional activator